MSETTTPLEERPPPHFLPWVPCVESASGGPFYLITKGVSFESRFRSSMLILVILSIFDLGQVRTGIFLLFSSLWPQSYPSQGRGQIFCTRLLLYLGIRGLRKCDPSHTFRPSNMKRNVGDPYRSSGPWGAGNPAVRGDFAIALINLMPDPTSGCQPGPPSFGDPLLGGLLGSIFPDSCGPGLKMTILDLLGPIFP